MASINDFKLLNIKSKKYFDQLVKNQNLSIAINDKLQERFGFYIYMLENICDTKDISDIIEYITDTEFNSTIYNLKFEDNGIDAIQIDKDNHKINLFNFKFRENFNIDKMQSINETIISTKFINALKNEDVRHLDGKLKIYAKKIIEHLKSNEIWKLNLYVISNESIELNKNDSNLQLLENLYDLEIIPIGLQQIKEIMSIRPNAIDAVLVLDIDAIMSYSESSISSSKSYIIRLSNSELVRITSDDNILREDYKLEDMHLIANANMEFSVLFDNVRGFIQKSKFNINISKSLKEDPARFFMYNNGITMTASDITALEVNANKKVKLTIKDFQILNGGQTLRSIHNFNKLDKENATEYLSQSEILVRVFKTTSETGLTNKIAEYTNSQNSISNIDLKSLSAEQIQLEQYLDEYNIIYARKIGDTGLSENKNYLYKISMERFGQILFSLKGFPNKASNQKKQIFDKYYSDIFGEDNLIIADAPSQILKYFEIKKVYDQNTKGYKSSDQKIFYIIYMDLYIERPIDKQIEMLEKIIKQFQPENEVADARKLIQIKFKDFLDKKINAS